jgi:glycerophosphoryl diester phosphodiesterase
MSRDFSGTTISPPLIVAHRGASAYLPGNTIAAFQLAAEQSADYIELDVHMSRDNKVVICHNWHLSVEGQPVPLAHLSLAEIRMYASLAREGNTTLETIIPTFEEVVDWLRTNDKGIIIEVKNCPIQYPNVTQHVLRALKTHDLVERAYIVSFDHNVVVGLKEWVPGIHTGILYIARLANLRETIRFIDVDWVETPTDYLTENIIDIIHQEGARVCSWSTNNIEEIEKLCRMGVDMITTDYPDVVRKHIDTFYIHQSSSARYKNLKI